MLNQADSFFMGLAVEEAMKSTCISTRVGAVLVQEYDNLPNGNTWVHHLSASNGVASKEPGDQCNDCCKHFLNDHNKMLSQTNRPAHSAWSDANEIHAEMRVIMDFYLNGGTLKGATLYTTASPCDSCTKHLELYALKGAITRVVYLDKYDRGGDDWIHRLKKFGVIVDKIERQDLNLDFGNITFSNVE